ncbi:MAG TPA: GNAT family N-acetyltransferase [Caulobacteraceae bacterium]|jgi:GNAT superfamily N-acetyltransferase
MEVGAIEIRPARRSEALAVARVHVAADRETYTPIFGAAFEEVPLAESLARWETALAAGQILLVAAEGEAIVGFTHADDAWMSSLYLLATHHRRGLGAALLAALCERLRTGGIEEVGFKCVVGNHRALAFYAAMGACRLGRETAGQDDKTWEECVLSLATDQPAASRRG